jgi:protein O-GlcNAc transferase
VTLHDPFEIALSHHRAGRLAEAETAYRLFLADHPAHADALHMLGTLAAQTGRLDDAEDLIRRAIRIRPDDVGAYNNLANLLKQKGRLDDAIAAYRRAIELKPDYAEAHSNLGNALKDARQLDQAIASYRQAIRLKPDYADAHSNLGNALKDRGLIDEAIAAYRQSIFLQLDFAGAHSNLGNALVRIGQVDEAIACYRRAISLDPRSADTHSNLVKTLHSDPACDAATIRDELSRWNRQHALPLRKYIQPHTNVRDPDRRLRIGYVSADFFHNALGQNLLPLLRQHDHKQMEIFCYSNVARPDALTDELKRHADTWRSIVGLSDSQGAAMIRQDHIDILVDLMLHTARNRLLLFARKPAPVQISYLGYCSSTGLDTIDCRLSDPYLDPPDSDLSVYTERTLRLPETYWFYSPGGPAPEPSPLPAIGAGYVTFGCLNSFAKVSTPTLDLWSKILLAVPSSKLILHSLPGNHLDNVRQQFARNGVSPDRLEFVGWQPWTQYVQTYHRIDIALDCFPWSGGITTCDALWMGVPVVTLVGQLAVGRGGASILSNIGVPELIASAPDQYVEIATNLANDLPRLSEWHRTLRPRMLASPLMNAPRFARNIEAVYRETWRTWCNDPHRH